MHAYIEQRRPTAPGADLWVGVHLRTCEGVRFSFAGHRAGHPFVTGEVGRRDGRSYLMLDAEQLMEEQPGSGKHVVRAEMQRLHHNLTAMGLTPRQVRWSKTVSGEMMWEEPGRSLMFNWVAIRLPDGFQPPNGAGVELVMVGGSVPRDGAE